MNGIKTGLGITPGEHIISADSALSRNIRHCFCLSCHGRLILQTDAQGAWFEHDLHALSEQQKGKRAARTVLTGMDPAEKEARRLHLQGMTVPDYTVKVRKWFCVMCDEDYEGEKCCPSCGTGVYSREGGLQEGNWKDRN